MRDSFNLFTPAVATPLRPKFILQNIQGKTSSELFNHQKCIFKCFFFPCFVRNVFFIRINTSWDNIREDLIRHEWSLEISLIRAGPEEALSVRMSHWLALIGYLWLSG